MNAPLIMETVLNCVSTLLEVTCAHVSVATQSMLMEGLVMVSTCGNEITPITPTATYRYQRMCYKQWKLPSNMHKCNWKLLVFLYDWLCAKR